LETGIIVVILMFFIGLPACIFIRAAMDQHNDRNTVHVETSSGNGRVKKSGKEARRRRARSLAELKRIDPNFSEVLFLDFARLLFNRYVEAQGSENTGPAALEPFLSPTAYKSLRRKRNARGVNGVTKISNLIIGKADIKDIDENSQSPSEGSSCRNKRSNAWSKLKGTKGQRRRIFC
jgi:hypothetical protein